MNIDEFARIARMMTEHNLTEFCIESDELKLSLKRGILPEAGPCAAVPAALSAVPAPVLPSVPSGQSADAEASDDSADDAATINSPVVGTFYRSPTPDAAPYANVGDLVEEDTVVCLIEAMKVMNEIKAELRGTIRRVLADNGEPVEFGQPLFEIGPVDD